MSYAAPTYYAFLTQNFEVNPVANHARVDWHLLSEAEQAEIARHRNHEIDAEALSRRAAKFVERHG